MEAGRIEPGEIMMHAGRAVRVVSGERGHAVEVLYLSSNTRGRVNRSELYRPSEPEAALHYALTPGRVPQ